jgi:hypothetical protein
MRKKLTMTQNQLLDTISRQPEGMLFGDSRERKTADTLYKHGLVTKTLSGKRNGIDRFIYRVKDWT